MTPQQLEALVLTTIDALRKGQKIEEDRVELKRAWPELSKVRQFAGAANKANGDYLIYIVGVDETDGSVDSRSSVDVADWWAQFSSRFDGVYPELLRNIVVPVGAGESVTALLWTTERAPYVLNLSGGSPEREVPMREGTRTRTARRDEMLRMLIPQTLTPSAVLLNSRVRGNWQHYTTEYQGEVNQTILHGEAEVFLEHPGPAGILLPAHEFAVSLRSSKFSFEAIAHRYYERDGEQPPAFGVYRREDGVAATGPGTFSFEFSTSLEGDHRDALADVNEWTIGLTFGVTGASRPIRLRAVLAGRRKYPAPDTPGHHLFAEWRGGR